MIEKYYVIKCDSCEKELTEPIIAQNKYEALENKDKYLIEENIIAKGNKVFCNAGCFVNYYKEK